MRKTKIYLDTTVLSYFRQDDAPEKTAETLEFWGQLKYRKDVEIYISSLTIDEISECDEQKLTNVLEILNQNIVNIIPANDEHKELVALYRNNNVLTDKSLDDLLHISIAVTLQCDYIVSWNFRHFVNPKTIKEINAINMLENLKAVQIVPPSMMLGGF